MKEIKVQGGQQLFTFLFPLFMKKIYLSIIQANNISLLPNLCSSLKNELNFVQIMFTSPNGKEACTLHLDLFIQGIPLMLKIAIFILFEIIF